MDYTDYQEPCCPFDASAYTGTPDSAPCPVTLPVQDVIKELDGFYEQGREAEAEGFCAKMAVTLTDEDGKEYQALSDVVFHFAGHTLKGTEPEGSYEEMGAAIPLTDAENAAKILLGEAE